MIEYATLSEAYGGYYIDTSKDYIESPPEYTSGVLDAKSSVTTRPVQREQSELLVWRIIKTGDKLRVNNGILSIDKRTGIKRFFTRDGRTKTLEFLSDYHDKNRYNSDKILFILSILKDTYKKDIKWCREAAKLVVFIKTTITMT